MMGHTHALTGAVAWLAAVPLLSDATVLHGYAVTLSPGQIAAGTIVSAGAAMLPDIDHHSGTIANTFGPVTKLLCKGVEAVTGGHRHATHSFLFTAVAGFGTWWVSGHYEIAWWVILFLLVGLGLRGLGVRIGEGDVATGILNAVASAGLVWWMHDLDFGWAGYAVGLGCFMHIFGDCCTPQGCPVFWPAPWRLGIPIVPVTDGKVERWVVTPLLTLGMVILAVRTALGDSAVKWLS